MCSTIALPNGFSQVAKSSLQFHLIVCAREKLGNPHFESLASLVLQIYKNMFIGFKFLQTDTNSLRFRFTERRIYQLVCSLTSLGPRHAMFNTRAAAYTANV